MLDHKKMKNPVLSPQRLQQKLLRWFDDHGRKDLPWQKNITPYRVWVSEIMLQQTQVTTVIPYFKRFMRAFPTIKKLATAPIDEVLHLWTGLGYYSRARNLHKAANILHHDYHGRFPNDLISLQQLPGIGRSTAGAILAIAFNQASAILDGNVKRVLTRVHAIEGWPEQPAIRDQLWEIAERYTPTKRTADYTQAMMDLGALLCKRSKPTCSQCPLQKNCLAQLQNRTTELPTKRPKKTLPNRHTHFLILQNAQGELLLEQRPPAGIWGGLWSFPEFSDLTELATKCQQRYGLAIKNPRAMTQFRHTFTHFHLHITPIVAELTDYCQQVMETQPTIWYKTNQPQAIGLATPIKRLLEELHHDPHGPLSKVE